MPGNLNPEQLIAACNALVAVLQLWKVTDNPDQKTWLTQAASKLNAMIWGA